jgi:hypothetical protein
MKNLNFIVKNSKIDSISKFNFYDKLLITKFNNFIIFSKISINEINFLRDFFFLSKLFFFWFNRKISILQVITDKKKLSNKGKNSLTFFIGCTIRDFNLIHHLNYIFNIIFFFTKKVDGLLKYKKVNHGLIYSFSNPNFLLGFKSERFFNINIKINIFFKFLTFKKYYKIKDFNKKIIKFYEKVFF